MVNEPQPPHLPRAALEHMYRHARETFPHECCGYLLGSGDGVRVVSCVNHQDQLHATDPEHFPRTAERAYNIGGKELLQLVRSFDGNDPATVIYHSHPRVGAYFSPEDVRAAEAAGYPVDYLVIDAQEGEIGGAVLFRRVAGTAEPRYDEVARFPGLAI
jgi:proteasome lid subunit RPN8/RPN11